MKCSEVRPLLTQLADDELAQKTSALSHILECNSCREEYRQIIHMKALISSQVNVDDLDQLLAKSEKSWREKVMKKPIAVALAASLLIVCLVVPAYGQNMLNTVQDWVKQLSVSTVETAYKIRTDLIGSNSEEQPNSSVSYATLDTALTRFGFPVAPPSYIPSEYSFFSVDIDEFNQGMTNLLTINYRTPTINQGEPSLTVTFEYISREISQREVMYPEGTLVKETVIAGNPGIFHKRNRGGLASVGLDIMLDQGEFTMLRVFMLVERDQYFDNIEAIEAELVKIAESVLQ